MSRLTINRLLLGAALASACGLAACEPNAQVESSRERPVIEAPAAPAEVALPAERAVAEAPEAAETPTPVETLPADQRTSEQTVQPESDTLFY